MKITTSTRHFYAVSFLGMSANDCSRRHCPTFFRFDSETERNTFVNSGHSREVREAVPAADAQLRQVVAQSPADWHLIEWDEDHAVETIA